MAGIGSGNFALKSSGRVRLFGKLYEVGAVFFVGTLDKMKWLGLTMKKGCTLRNCFVLLGFLAGAVWIGWVRTQPVSDFAYYQQLAAQIARGGQWGNTYTTVGYPIFLAPFYWLFGSSVWIAKIINLFLSMLNNLLVFNILKKMAIPKFWQKLIFSIFVFFPMNIYYNSLVASEILFTTLLLSSSLLYLSKLKYRYVLIGVVIGLNTMIKPFFPLFVLAVLLADIFSQRGLRKSIKTGLLILLLAGITISPWLYRNYLLIGELTYVSNNGGIVLYINNNSQNKRGGWMPAEAVENTLIKQPDYLAANLTERNKMLSRAAKAWIMSHPQEFFDLGVKRLKRTFGHYGDKKNGDIFFAFYGSDIPVSQQMKLFEAAEKIRKMLFLGGIASISIYTVICVYLFGLSLKEHRIILGQAKGWLLIIFTFYMFAGVYFLTEGQSRYAFPAVFSLVFFALMGVRGLYNTLKWTLVKVRG